MFFEVLVHSLNANSGSIFDRGCGFDRGYARSANGWIHRSSTGRARGAEAKGVGFQIYTCTETQIGPRWVLTAPEAKLLDASGKTIGSHFAGPTWKLEDGSQVQGERMASRPAPEADSVAWLLLRAKAGTGTGKFASIAFIRRTETHGGVASESGCKTGDTSRVSYTATYTFYTAK